MNRLVFYTFVTILCWLFVVKNMQITTNTSENSGSDWKLPADNRMENEKKEDKKMLEKADDYILSPAPAENIPFNSPELLEELKKDIEKMGKKLYEKLPELSVTPNLTY